MVRVITFNNRPDIYPPIYDDRIAAGIAEFLTIPHEHLHITSKSGDSWFYIELFKLQPCLLVAIDTIIVGSLNECVNMGTLTAIEEWKIPGEPNTSMLWVEGTENLQKVPITDKVKTDYPWGVHAEQRWLHEHAKLSFYPHSWTPSYKYSKIEEDARIVVFHGKPKPHEVGWKI